MLAAPDIVTDISVRMIFWNNEETGLNGSKAYTADREALQGQELPPDSGVYPEPTWLGMIQHDMILFDHGLPPRDFFFGTDTDIFSLVPTPTPTLNTVPVRSLRNEACSSRMPCRKAICAMVCAILSDRNRCGHGRY